MRAGRGNPCGRFARCRDAVRREVQFDALGSRIPRCELAWHYPESQTVPFDWPCQIRDSHAPPESIGCRAVGERCKAPALGIRLCGMPCADGGDPALGTIHCPPDVLRYPLPNTLTPIGIGQKLETLTREAALLDPNGDTSGAAAGCHTPIEPNAHNCRKATPPTLTDTCHAPISI